MNDSIPEIIELTNRYKPKGILIDTNILLVLLLGGVSRNLIDNYGRTNSSFCAEDYDILRRFLHGFEKIITTPNILTEVNSLSKKISENYRDKYCQNFSKIVSTQMEEFCLKSHRIVELQHFAKYGLTDSGIIDFVAQKDQKYLVLTDDFPLYGYLEKQNIDAINFNHLRTYFHNTTPKKGNKKK